MMDDGADPFRGTQDRPAEPQRLLGSLVALVHDEHVLLVRTVRNPSLWQPVGGRAEAGENALQCAVREVREETAVELDPADVTAVCMIMTGHGALHYYSADVTDRTLTLQGEEILEHRWVRRSHLLHFPAQPETAQFLTWWAGKPQS